MYKSPNKNRIQFNYDSIKAQEEFSFIKYSKCQNEFQKKSWNYHTLQVILYLISIILPIEYNNYLSKNMSVFIKREYDFAIRICAYLAGNYKKGPISVSKIAELLYISKPFATKIIYQLTSKKIITSVQGKAGGVYLSHNPGKLSLLAILQAMNFDSTINECKKVPTFCPLKATCKIHSFFNEQESILINNLKKATIAEFAFDNSAVKQKINKEDEWMH